jgi:uncharacterized repeat protein (TIGR03803 family)
MAQEGTNGITVGTIFSINTNGTGYQTLHAFGPGGHPYGALLVVGTSLYGMSYDGGSNSLGNIFVIGTDGGGFKDLHSFTGETNDGAYPFGSLILSGPTLYGVSSKGGSNFVGTVFAMNTNGSGFTVLHNFSTGDTWMPMGDLTISGSVLYGMTQNGGINSILGGGYGSGAVFQIHIDGSGYGILHSFEFPGPATDGSLPYGPLLLLNNELYGMTSLGGSTTNKGVIFALNPNALPVITTSNSLPVGDINAAYSLQLTAAGGTAPYTWTNVSGSLPAGLSLSSSGLISGKPTGGGTSYFSIKVTDHAGHTATQAFSLTVVPSDPALSVTITYPAASQQFSNLVNNAIGIAGTATSDVSVAYVRIKLNSGPWLNTFSFNGDTNWDFPFIAVIPGTNTVSAFAVDVYGNISKTNSVTFVDLVNAVLTVRTNGPGSISPGLNGMNLLEGATYSLTASAPKTITFVNWTDGSNNIVTNGTTVKFTMVNHLILTATFADTNPPVLTITTPKTGTKLSNDLVTVTGTATDNVAVANVFCFVSGGAPGSATLSNTTWSAQVSLVPGTNNLIAYAVDTSGNHSTTNSIKLIYILSAPLTLNIVGAGTVSPNYSNALLAIGGHYTMKATATTGFSFYYWDVGGVMTNNSTVNFTMVSNLVATVNFKDITPPTVTITAPKTGGKFTNTTIQVSGTASDNVGVTYVAVQNNGDGWVPASGTNSWSAALPMSTGNNTVQAVAMDAAGNYSKTNTVSFLGFAPAQQFWAPFDLTNSQAELSPSTGGIIYLSFGGGLFNWGDINTNDPGDAGIGQYEYQEISTNFGLTQLSFDGPPIVNSNTVDVAFAFTNYNTGNYTNYSTLETGTFSLATQVASLLPANWSGLKFTFSEGKAVISVLNLTSGGNFTLKPSNSATIAGTYIVTDYSPVGAFLTFVSTTTTGQILTYYLQLTYTAAGKGIYNTYEYTDGSFTAFYEGTFTSP